MTQQLIATTPANSGLGDSPKKAYDKCNANFSDLYGGTSGQLYLPPFTGGVATTVSAKLAQMVSVEDFGADPTGVADSAPAFNAAILSVSSDNSAGGTIFVPAGQFKLNSMVAVPAGIIILGTGYQGTIIQPGAVIAALFNITGGLSAIQGCQLVNASSFATSAVQVTKPHNNERAAISFNYIANFTNGIYWLTGDAAQINDNVMVSNTLHMNFNDDGLNSLIFNNYTLGGSGILFNVNLQGPEGITINDNQFLLGKAGYGIAINSALQFTITNNVFDQIWTGPCISITSATPLGCQDILLSNNYIGRTLGQSGAQYGLILTGNVANVHSLGNTFVGWQQAGIYCDGSSGSPVINFRSDGDVFSSADTCVREIELGYATNCAITGATFVSGTASIIENTGCSGRVDNCQFGVLPSLINLRQGRQIGGITNIAGGTGTLLNGQVSVTVTHGINNAQTPSAVDTVVNFTAANGNMGAIWLSNFNGTTFQINVGVAPTANTAFSWKIDMTR